MDRHYKDLSWRSRYCMYCGEPATSKDHVLALSKFTFDYPESLYIVPCCAQYNNLAGGRLFKSATEKQNFIREAIRKRFQWIMTETSQQRREQYASLLITAQRRLKWPDVISVEDALPRPELGKGFARLCAVTPFTQIEPAWHDEALILDPDFDELSEWYV